MPRQPDQHLLSQQYLGNMTSKYVTDLQQARVLVMDRRCFAMHDS